MKDEQLWNLLNRRSVDFGNNVYAPSYDLFPEYLFAHLHPEMLQSLQSFFDNDLIEEKVVDFSTDEGGKEITDGP